jgi:hypothetical protein
MDRTECDVALRRQVERAVRPLKAEFERKMRMREELWSLIQKIHAEEQSRSESAEIALARTLERFGDPSALSQELQASVPKREIWGTWLDRRLARGPHESVARFALRVALLPSLLFPVLTALAEVILLATRGTGLDAIQLRVLLSLCAFAGVNTFVLAWLGETYCERAERAEGPLWKVPRLWLGAAAGAAFIWLAGVALMAAVGGTWQDVAWAAQHWLAMSPLVVGLYLSVALLIASLRRRELPWKKLEIE